MTPVVSIIMPAWRPHPDWLREAVTSVLAEDACDIELIVVDDGCPEPVAPLLQTIDDPRLRVLRIEHAGPYGARNAAIAQARGEYLRFFDCDDIAEPGSTGRLLALARSGEEVLAYGATLMCDEALMPQQTVTSSISGDAVETCVMGAFEVFVVSILFPRAVVERVGPWEEQAFTVSGDWDFVLRALEQAPVRPLGEIVTRYRRHGSSVTKSARVEAGAVAAATVLGRYFDRHPERRGTALERRAYARMHLDRTLAHAARGDLRLALRHLVRAGRRRPLAAAAVAARLMTGVPRRVSRALRTRAGSAGRPRA